MRDAVRKFPRIVTAILLAAGLIFAAHCERLKNPPLPNGIPAGAVRDRKMGLWQHTTPDGQYSVYFADGKLAMTGKITGGLRSGVWNHFSMDGKVITTAGEYREDWKDGVWQYYDSDGRLYLRMEYRLQPRREFMLLFTHDYGNENGVYMRYFPEGTLEEKGNFTSGYYEGPVVRYYRSGKKAMEGQYEKDMLTGRWKYYYPEGAVEREENYHNGVLNGPMRCYYPDGKLRMETYYANGKETGPQRIFSPAG